MSDQVQYEIVTVLIRIAAFAIIPVVTCMLWLFRKAVTLQAGQEECNAWRAGVERREQAFANHVKLEVLGVVNQTVNSQYLEIRTAIAVHIPVEHFRVPIPARAQQGFAKGAVLLAEADPCSCVAAGNEGT